jgi:predicted amidohydrolase YtcJ
MRDRKYGPPSRPVTIPTGNWIGDSANRQVLDQYKATFRQYPEAASLRWRIEHVQHLHPDDVPRFAWLNVIASMQSIHCTSDAPYVEARLGKRRAENGAYLWKSLIKSGATVMEGTDVPVERLDPFQNFYAAVTRKSKKGHAFYPSQRKSRKEALRGYTANNAYGMDLENLTGTLEKGKAADITILDTDLLTCDEAAIREATVIYTIIDGKIKYRQP